MRYQLHPAGPDPRKGSGRKAAEVITHDFIEPSRLTGTSFPDTPAMPEPNAHGYYAGEDAKGPFEDFTVSNPNRPWTAGAMISTLEDLRVRAKVLATGTELSPGTQRERLTFRPFTTGNEGASYGLGILNYSGFLGHCGMIFGYTTAIFYLPEADATFVLSGNQRPISRWRRPRSSSNSRSISIPAGSRWNRDRPHAVAN